MACYISLFSQTHGEVDRVFIDTLHSYHTYRALSYIPISSLS